ncbi:hypothetical protein ACQKFO_23120 [Rossellomorea sp. NPDC071047]|uniref:hypothetical protein n=1 Tax=Rossellomorea sp. NPDC071047 TaxID=3390675 RepID=UPI003D03187D
MFENVVSGIIATVICSISLKVLEALKNNRLKEATADNSDEQILVRTITMAKKQLIFCLSYLFLIFIILIGGWISSSLFFTFVLVTVVFTLLLVWGAFESVYEPFKTNLEKIQNRIPDEDTKRYK